MFLHSTFDFHANAEQVHEKKNKIRPFCVLFKRETVDFRVLQERLGKDSLLVAPRNVFEWNNRY